MMTDVYGYIRFSFLGRNDTKIGRTIEDEQERFDVLFAPERMEERFYFFENITLPSLRYQTDQDFRIVIISSKAMPEQYKTRLNTLVADTPQIEIIYSDAAHVTDELNPWIEKATASINTPTVHFRLDDDDAICNTMIARLRDTIPYARRDQLISYPRGFYLAYHKGRPYLTRKFEPYIAIAWAFVNAPGQVRNPYQGKHGSHHHNVPSMLDPGFFAYIHVAHESSDTINRQGRKLKRALNFDPGHDTESGTNRISALLRRGFPGFERDKLLEIISNAPGRAAVDSAEHEKGPEVSPEAQNQTVSSDAP